MSMTKRFIPAPPPERDVVSISRETLRTLAIEIQIRAISANDMGVRGRALADNLIEIAVGLTALADAP